MVAGAAQVTNAHLPISFAWSSLRVTSRKPLAGAQLKRVQGRRLPATKKAVAKKTAVQAKKSAPSKAPVGTKAPVQKMTKTQVIQYMVEQMEGTA